MGWQDAPVVRPAKAKQPWEDAPIVKPAAAQPEQPGMLRRGLAFVGRQLERVPAGIRGYTEAIQTGDSYNAPNKALQGFLEPESVQTSAEMMGRFGADTAMNKPQIKTPPPDAQTQWNALGNMPDEIKAKILGFRPGVKDTSYTSTAQELGNLYDFAAPTGLELIPGAKMALKAGRGTAKAGAKQLTKAAEKSILEKYSMAKAMKMAPTMGSGKEIQAVEEASKAIENAPSFVADKLREHDLLYNPGKANFNLQRDLKKYGEQIGATVADMKARDVSVNLQSVFNDYMAKKTKVIQESGKGVGSIADLETKVGPKIQDMITRLGENPSIDKAVAFRQELQDMVKNWDGGTGKPPPLVQRVAKELQYQVNQAIAASDKTGGPTLAALNEKYGDLKDLQPLIEDAYKRGFGRSAVGRDVRPLPFTREGVINRGAEIVGSPIKSVMNLKPEWADALANRGRTVSGLSIPEIASTVTPEELAAIKAPFIPESQGLPPRRPSMRRPLEGKPTYIERPKSVLDEGLPPRKSSYTPPNQRRALSPIAPDPSLDVTELGKVMDADAAKEIAANKYQSERLRVLWDKVKEAKTQRQKTALMNLIRATHSAKGK